MIYNLLADLVMLLHFAFILFAVLGALLLLRWPRLIWLHLAAVLWAMGIEFYDGICPLTLLENQFHAMAGADGYSVSFVDHYLGAVIYPDALTPTVRIVLGVAVLLINVALYGWLINRQRYRSRH